MKPLLTTLILACLVQVSTLALAAQNEPRELAWDDLMPEGWEPPPPPAPASIFDDESGPAGAQQSPGAPVVEALNQQFVKIPGFVLPIEYEGNQVTEFLLVPYVGACIHVPAPPGNQVVYVKLETPFAITGLYDAIWVEGTMLTQRVESAYAAAQYTLEGQNVTMYVWD